MDGAGERDRTAGLPFTRRLLCLLSYTGGRLVHGSRPHRDMLILPLACRTAASGAEASTVPALRWERFADHAKLLWSTERSLKSPVSNSAGMEPSILSRLISVRRCLPISRAAMPYSHGLASRRETSY